LDAENGYEIPERAGGKVQAKREVAGDLRTII
jgi:hypothetical protein